jgi:hypothetical protein
MIELRDDIPPKSTRQTSTSRKEMVLLSRKEEAIRRLNERKERLTEFEARKEKQNAHLRAERELQAKAKSENIERMKRIKEERRLDTLRKISERERRAEDLLREREKFSIAGRNRTVEVNEWLLKRKKLSQRGGYSEEDNLVETDKKIQSISHDQINIEHNEEVENQTKAMDKELKKDVLEDKGDRHDSLSKTPCETDNKTVSLRIVEANISLKRCLSQMMDSPLEFISDQLSQLQTKVEELEETINEKNDEIEELSQKVDSWKIKSICIILSVTLLLHGSGLYTQMKTKTSSDMKQFMKTLPPYLIQCFKIKL